MYPKILPPLLDTLARQMWEAEESETWDEFLDMTWASIVEESFDERFVNHTHGEPHTYRSGCRGAACSAANRIMGREQRARTGVDPRTKAHVLLGEQATTILLDYFREQLIMLRDQNRKAFLRGEIGNQRAVGQ